MVCYTYHTMVWHAFTCFYFYGYQEHILGKSNMKNHQTHLKQERHLIFSLFLSIHISVFDEEYYSTIKLRIKTS